MSTFANVQAGSTIYTQAFALTKAFQDDKSDKKVNLSVGAYRTDDGKPWVLPVVRKAEIMLANDETLNKEYLPVLGLEDFTNASTGMLLGSASKAIAEGKVISTQTLSGTGALRVAAEFLSRQMNFNTFYYSAQTWENHGLIFMNAGFTDGRTYRYWDSEKRCIDFEGFKEDLNNAPENAVIILHGCAHNPTGSDPTHEQWKELAQIIKSRKLFPLFDCAYQGFASGNLDNDAWSVRYFADNGFELLCCQSYAKNFGLYNERVGNLVIIVSDPSVIANIKSQLLLVIRAMYSNPPSHGARIVAKVLNSPQLYEEWKTCISTMAERIIKMRKQLRERLEALKTPGTWSHITTQIGMFSFTGLTPKQVEYVVNECHVYMMGTGRISMCGINSSNIDHVAQSIHDAVVKIPN
uniref:Aspartate aminotransferase n=1 Tax=Nilaparvata lugens TaxID=108931 RepID=A0A1I9WLB9_NILLU|nr:seminal fluid protein [Nilaparvata lugens]